jgi:anti-sigma factor RsiW
MAPMNDTTCAAGVALLADYLEGVLADDVREGIDAHVAGCPKCQAFIASYRAAPGLLRAATDAVLPPELGQSLRQALRTKLGI